MHRRNKVPASSRQIFLVVHQFSHQTGWCRCILHGAWCMVHGRLMINELLNDAFIHQTFVYGKPMHDESLTTSSTTLSQHFTILSHHPPNIVTTTQPSLPGFYDPCYGEDKELSVSYTFQRKPHKHLFKEGAVISLPSDGELKG